MPMLVIEIVGFIISGPMRTRTVARVGTAVAALGERGGAAQQRQRDTTGREGFFATESSFVCLFGSGER